MLKNKNVPASSKEAIIDKKEKTAILIGFSLIILILIFTLFRSFNWSAKPASQMATENQAEKINDYETVSSKDIAKRLSNNEKLVLVDIRSFDDFIREHIIDSVSVPAAGIATTTKLKKTDELIIVGANGEDPDINTAVESMKSNDFTNFKVLAGGITSWALSNEQTVGFGDPTSFTDQAKVFYIAATDARDMLKNDPSRTAILDVRDPSAFAAGHLPNAINIPLLDLEKRRNEVPALKTVLVFGVTEVQEFQAAAQLHNMSMTLAYVVKGAMPKWEEAKFEITK